MFFDFIRDVAVEKCCSTYVVVVLCGVYKMFYSGILESSSFFFFFLVRTGCACLCLKYIYIILVAKKSN